METSLVGWYYFRRYDVNWWFFRCYGLVGCRGLLLVSFGAGLVHQPLLLVLRQA